MPTRHNFAHLDTLLSESDVTVVVLVVSAFLSLEFIIVLIRNYFTRNSLKSPASAGLLFYLSKISRVDTCIIFANLYNARTVDLECDWHLRRASGKFRTPQKETALFEISIDIFIAQQ